MKLGALPKDRLEMVVGLGYDEKLLDREQGCERVEQDLVGQRVKGGSHWVDLWVGVEGAALACQSSGPESSFSFEP